MVPQLIRETDVVVAVLAIPPGMQQPQNFRDSRPRLVQRESPSFGSRCGQKGVVMLQLLRKTEVLLAVLAIPPGMQQPQNFRYSSSVVKRRLKRVRGRGLFSACAETNS